MMFRSSVWSSSFLGSVVFVQTNDRYLSPLQSDVTQRLALEDRKEVDALGKYAMTLRKGSVECCLALVTRRLVGSMQPRCQRMADGGQRLKSRRSWKIEQFRVSGSGSPATTPIVKHYTLLW
ncbi:unnamed protein product [Soboliphyme baturini]|uniref:Secreted protein n=1 Tax=Soboliphyme baturini TaxID=241478 RepID=A0A183INR6_9BILA|nr:unnamed protein product [Soboliphyme baturini]